MCTIGWGTDGNTARLTAHSAEGAHAWAETQIREGDEKEERNQASFFKCHLVNWSQREKWSCSGKKMQRRRASGAGAITSSKNGLFPLLIRVLWVCPHALTLTTGLMLLPGSWRPSMTRTRIWTRQGFTITSSSLQLHLGINSQYSPKTFLKHSGRNVDVWDFYNWRLAKLVVTSSKRVWLFRKAQIRTKAIPGSPEVCWPRLCASFGWVGLAFARVSQADSRKRQRTHLHLGLHRPQAPPLHRPHHCLLRGKINKDYTHMQQFVFHQVILGLTSVHLRRIYIRRVI